MTDAAAPDGVALRRAAAASGAVAFATRSVQGVVSLGVSLLMARLLTPGDFGLFAMVMPLGILGMIAANYSVQGALLQHPAATDADVHDYYHFAAVVALGVAAAMAVFGVALAAFYDEPRIVPIALALCVVVVAMPRGALQEAHLKRALRFPAVHTLQLATLSLGLLTGVIAAWRGAGYWALPLQVLVMELARLLAINVLSDWRPRPRRNVATPMVGTLKHAWRSLLALRLASWINDQPELVAVGRLGGSVVLGHYGTARRWAWYPFEDPFLALTEVVIASGAIVRDDADRFRTVMSRSIQAMLSVTLPVVAYIVAEAPTVVRTLLGTQWDDAVPFLRVLGVATFFAIITRTSTWILLARGANDRLVRWSVTRQLPATVAAVAVGLVWGAMGVATAMAISSALLVYPAVRFVVEGMSLHVADVARAASRPVAASLVAAGADLALGGGLGALHSPTRLATTLAFFALTFVASWVALPGGKREVTELLALVKSMVARRGGTA